MSERAEAARDAFYQARWEQKKHLDPIRFGVRWADANPQPRTITHDDMGAAYAAFMEAEGHPVRRLIVALSALGIEVTDDE